MNIIPSTPAAITLDALESAGWQAWIVGGWVRDSLMGRPPHDADIATNAPWRETARVLRAKGLAVHETGTKHGTVTAIVRGDAVEITTYRVEGPYSDSRHPDHVEFVDDIRLDLARRDFTMNAIAFHPNRGILDPFGGAADIEARTIRAVGDAHRRFAEDPLRVMRAVRFASQMGFAIEPSTRQSAHELAPLLERVAKERIGAEFTKLLLGAHAGRLVEDELAVVGIAVPELVALQDFKLKSKRHAYDLLGHLAHSVDAAPIDEAQRWAALLHDIAKPHANHDHAQRSAQQAQDIMRRLRVKRRVVAEACDAIAWHMTSFAPNVEAVRWFTALLGGDARRARNALTLQRSDALGHGPGNEQRAREVDIELRMLDSLISNGEALGVGDLKIDGNDVAQRSDARGKQIGQTLNALLAAVVEGEVPNERNALLASIPKAESEACEQIFQKRLEKFLTKR